MIRRVCFVVATLSLVVIGISGCGDDDLAGGTIFIDIDHDVSGTSLTFTSIQYTNAVGQEYSVQTLKYYLSNVVFHRTDGSEHAVKSVHYRDALDIATRSWEVEIAGGTYNAMTFTFGLDSTYNTPDALPATLENINMKWPDPLGGGYHYMKLEGKYIDSASGDTLNYGTHTGRNDTHPHFFEVTLPFAAITVDGNAHTATVVMDLNEWYTDPNDYAFPATPMIMGNAALQDMLEENGHSVFRLTGMVEN